MAGALTTQRLEDLGATPAEAEAAPAVFLQFPAGHAAEAEREQRVQVLRQLQLEAVYRPEWRAQPGGRTYCNRAFSYIAQGMGYHAFPPGALANDMIAQLAGDPDWREELDLAHVHRHAMRGGLAAAALVEHPHGHVCTVAPEPMQPSTSWGGPVPMVANVGAENGVLRLSQVFSIAARPLVRFFLLRPEAT